ncbi:protein-tyrosine-phosphatase [Geothrix limicola]|uniref:Protein-tyrosine-phosphatase n=1 Tax=Geothrix limicola TaxID=2927978 RepID=A0ABQ5QKN7_9BACT|nr:protein-tyrosine-phosphatase [Geothrix limicola]
MDSTTELSLPVAFNFRDVGGLSLLDGNSVNRQCLFRSAEPEKLDLFSFQKFIRSQRIKTVIDLRSSDEQRKDYSNLVDVETQFLSVPLFESINRSWANPKNTNALATARRYLEILEVGSSAIREIIGILSDKQNHPVLVHCAAGRDRTGIVIAVLLKLSGCESSELSNDYAKSDQAVSDGYRALPETIDHLFDLVNQKYSSLTAFMNANGVTNERIELMKKSLTRPNP